MNRSYTVLNCLLVVFFSVASGILVAEDKEPVAKSPDREGFRFLRGNPEVGQRAFTTLKCIECHSVKNVDLPAPPDPRWIDMELAFETGFVKRYEDIILAITNPRHVMNERYRAILKDAELHGGIDPLMPDLTDDMSAKQLMDLTAFLHQVYLRELPGYGDVADEQ